VQCSVIHFTPLMNNRLTFIPLLNKGKLFPVLVVIAFSSQLDYNAQKLLASTTIFTRIAFTYGNMQICKWRQV